MANGKPGRKPHVPTDKDRKMVQSMIGFGITQNQISKIMGVSADTLQRHYRDELDTGVARANSLVAQNLFSIATGKGSGSVAAAIFWMKTRAQWREVNRQEITGADGGPIESSVEQRATIDATQLTPEQRDVLRAALISAKKP